MCSHMPHIAASQHPALDSMHNLKPRAAVADLTVPHVSSGAQIIVMDSASRNAFFIIKPEPGTARSSCIVKSLPYAGLAA